MDAEVGLLGLHFLPLLRPGRRRSQVLVSLSLLHRRLVLRPGSRDVALRRESVCLLRVGWATADVRNAFWGRSFCLTTRDPFR